MYVIVEQHDCCDSSDVQVWASMVDAVRDMVGIGRASQDDPETIWGWSLEWADEPPLWPAGIPHYVHPIGSTLTH